jgi:hypothetical protein
MTVSRRKLPEGFSSPVEETTEAVTETPVEVVEKKVEEVVEKVVKVKKEKVHPAVTPVLGNNPKPVAPRTPSKRNTPRFSPQR